MALLTKITDYLRTLSRARATRDMLRDLTLALEESLSLLRKYAQILQTERDLADRLSDDLSAMRVNLNLAVDRLELIKAKTKSAEIRQLAVEAIAEIGEKA